MPELPEVELMSRALHRWCAGRELLGLDVLDEKLLPAEDLGGLRISRVERRAKLSLIFLDGRVLALHYRMTGGVCALSTSDARPPYARLRLRLCGEGLCGEGPPAVALVDPRRFATARLFPEEELAALLAAFGPEPWPQPRDGAWWAARFSGLRGPIKPALLHQDRVAGIGNILASECLFLARIDPRAPVPSLRPEQWEAFAAVVGPFIDAVLEAEQQSFQDERGIAYVNTGGPNPFAVYGREGQPCPRCGAPIQREVQSGRGTWLCEPCLQSLPARRSKARTRSSSSSGSKGLGR